MQITKTLLEQTNRQTKKIITDYFMVSKAIQSHQDKGFLL